ncbi:group II truncated hemoglobin [Myxococcota bacterium]|nr:group II truncated hemoglobin [Myxococcota bacterium]
MAWEPAPGDTPYDRIGGTDRVFALVDRFYEIMAREEPALAKLHPTNPDGTVEAGNQQRFALFLVGWLGGPQDYMTQHGHPRLRMRHGRVAVDVAMRDAWVRCMKKAMDEQGVTGEVREYLDQRFAEVADFLRNVRG